MTDATTPLSSISRIMKGMPSRLNAKAAAGINAVIQFNLSGDHGGNYFAVIENATCTLFNGSHADPTITLKMSDQTYLDMAMGRLTGQQAFFKRKLTYSGDMGLAIKLGSLFHPARETIGDGAS